MQHYLVYNINNEQNCPTARPTVYLKEGRRPVQHIERNIDWQPVHIAEDIHLTIHHSLSCYNKQVMEASVS